MRPVDARSLQTVAGSERSHYILITVAMAAFAIVAGLGLLLSGGPDPLPMSTPAGDSGDDVDDDASDVAGSVASNLTPVVTTAVFLSRDPFDPVVPEPEPAVSETDTDPDGTVDPLDPKAPPPIVPGNPGDPRCVGDRELVCDGQVVTLIDTTVMNGEPVAIIKVGTTIDEVRVGQTFANSLTLVAIDGSTITILYGDESNVLTPGASVLK